ncbi:GumC family protein [Ketobacter sp.]|uniref:GumC family protein n=1 Tax=Ketobacter sp. TaxID=2083498 RepID=UPI000F242061|nr:hypothetical protein [Ketobacter sp.]RLT96776.1 MAG: hypothetical protein D9N14_12110 [Ketobacter sp.]
MMKPVEPHKQLKIPTDADRRRARRRGFLRNPYVLWAALCYGIVTAVLLAYLRQTPVYSSSMALVLPGSGSSNSVRLNEVGHVSSSTQSPYSSATFNPRVNYREILKSREVLNAAATEVALPVEVFGLPRIKLTEQTSILSVELRAPSGTLAQAKALALYAAFQDHLDALRKDEAQRRDESIMKVLDQYIERVNVTRRALVEFQQRSLLVSEEQLQQHTRHLSELRSQIHSAQAEEQHLRNMVAQLSYDLGVSPDLAGRAFKLQTDAQFVGHLKELDESAKQISEFSSVWGRNHPKVKASETRLVKAEKAAYDRSATILGMGHAQMLHTVNLNASPQRANLFKDLIGSYAQVQGIHARVDDLRLTEQRLQDELRILAREATELKRLQREHDLAEAVYTSAAAELEAGKADIFASYPVVQLMTAPNDPMQKTSPSLKVAAAGGVLGYLFISAVLIIIWQRAFLLARLLNRS